MVPEIPFEHVRDVFPIRISRNTEISVEKRERERERVCRKPDRVPDRSGFLSLKEKKKKRTRDEFSNENEFWFRRILTRLYVT